jgi:outer membrane protein OmpA-like peptidoglycan-associated protein
MKKHFVTFACLFLFAIHVAAQDIPKAEIYGGYTFLRFNASSPTNAFTANGGIGSFQYNFNKHIGFVAELGGEHNGSLTIGSSKTLHPDQTAFTYLFGPRVFINKGGVVSPFFEFMVGGFHNSRSFSLPDSLLPHPVNPISGVTETPLTTTTKFSSTQNAAAMLLGGGIDIRLGRKVSFRPIELDYVPTNFSPFNIAGLGSINNAKWQQNLRYSTGLAFRFGGAPPPPPRASCSATPTELLAWNGPVNATVEPVDFHPKHDLTYNWSSTSGQLGGQGTSATVDTTSLAPGDYTVTANVVDPKGKQNNSASCSTSFKVKQPQNPQVGCSLSPTSVKPGEPITVSVRGSSPDGSRIEKRNFSASAGALKEGETSVGSQPGEFTTIATLDTTNAPPGTISVNVGVTDVHGYSGSCIATAGVNAPPPPPQVVSETLISECDFNNSKKLARVDNQCKAILDEVALRMQHEPNGKVVIVGYASEIEEGLVNDVESLRAANAKAYLTGGEAKQQIDANRVEARKSGARDISNKARFYFVPEGGNFTLKDTTTVDEAALPANRTGAPKK